MRTGATRRSVLRKRIAGEQWMEALEELREGKDPADTVSLLELLIHPSTVVREEALRTLGYRGGVLARIAARSAMADPDVHVRDMAATVLGQIGNRRDIPWLVVALDDPHWFVRCSAASSLGSLGGPTARRSLVRALTGDPNADVRRWAAAGLAALGDLSIVSTLEAALAEQADPHVRGAVHMALYELRCRPLEALLSLLHDDDSLIRFQVLTGLEDCLHPEDKDLAIAAVRELLKGEEHPGVRGGVEALLRKLLDTPEESP